MNAPLSQFLTQFSAPPPVFVTEKAAVNATLVLTSEELDARLDAARSEVELAFEAKIKALTAAHHVETEGALANARAEWTRSEAESLTTRLAQATQELRDMLTDRLAAILRPFVVDQIVARTKRELGDALDRLLADPKQPVLSVRGPADLVAALSEKHPSAGIEWVIVDACDVLIVADATRVETCLAAALADITKAEA